jgi:hypothetical protein
MTSPLPSQSTRPVEKTVRLGEWLVQRCLLDQQQVDAALNECQFLGCRVGDAIVHLGLLDRRTIEIQADLRQRHLAAREEAATPARLRPRWQSAVDRRFYATPAPWLADVEEWPKPPDPAAAHAPGARERGESVAHQAREPDPPQATDDYSPLPPRVPEPLPPAPEPRVDPHPLRRWSAARPALAALLLAATASAAWLVHRHVRTAGPRTADARRASSAHVQPSAPARPLSPASDDRASSSATATPADHSSDVTARLLQAKAEARRRHYRRALETAIDAIRTSSVRGEGDTDPLVELSRLFRRAPWPHQHRLGQLLVAASHEPQASARLLVAAARVLRAERRRQPALDCLRRAQAKAPESASVRRQLRLALARGGHPRRLPVTSRASQAVDAEDAPP